MLNLNYTPIPLRYTYIVGQSWHFLFCLNDLTSPINLGDYTVTGLVFFEKEQKKILKAGNEITIGADGKTFELVYDFLQISTDAVGNSIVTPALSTLPIGTYTVQIFFTNTVAEDIVPIFIYVDVVAAPSDDSIARAYKNQVVNVTLSNRIVINIETGGTSSGSTGTGGAVIPASQVNAGIARFANLSEAIAGQQVNTMIAPATLAAFLNSYMTNYGNLRKYAKKVNIVANQPYQVVHNFNLLTAADCFVDTKLDGRRIMLEISYDTVNMVTIYSPIDILNLNVLIIA